MSAIPTCAVTGAIPGDGGACGDCDPCIDGEPLVPDAVKRLIAEKNSLLHQLGELEGKHDDYVVAANANVVDLNRDIELKKKALKAVEEWWLSDGMKHFTGAPYAMFAVRAALADR